MSRSRRKTPIFGNCDKRVSEKHAKRAWHKKFRHATKVEVNVYCDIENLILTDFREISDLWGMPKDGKHYNNNADKWLWMQWILS